MFALLRDGQVAVLRSMVTEATGNMNSPRFYERAQAWAAANGLRASRSTCAQRYAARGSAVAWSTLYVFVPPLAGRSVAMADRVEVIHRSENMTTGVPARGSVATPPEYCSSAADMSLQSSPDCRTKSAP